MNIEMLTRFFMWCTILNAGLLLLSFLAVTLGLGSDFVYRMHSKFFPLPRNILNTAFYSFIGVYKILVIVFNLVPWLALLIIA